MKNTDRPLIAVDLGGTKIMAALVDPRFRVKARYKKKTKAYKGPREVVRRLIRCVNGLFDEHRVDRRNIAAMGLAVAGSVDDGGRILFAPNLGLKNAPLREILAKEFNLPVFLENDVNAGTLAEARLGAGRGYDSVLGIFLGTGVGGGIVLNGQLYRGATHVAGEIGHMILNPDGPTCPCGQRGCFEAFAGRLAIAREIKKAVKKGTKTLLTDIVEEKLEELGSGDLRRALENGDALTRKALKKAAYYTGLAVANLANVLNPGAVVLGGGVMEAVGKFLLPFIRESARSHAVPAAVARLKLLPSLLKDDAVALGAAVAAREGL